MPDITATVLADSVWNKRRTLTLTLEYPRLIHSEFKTYGLIRSNASSSRAIPTERVLNLTEEVEPYIPEVLIKNGKGMGGVETLKDKDAEKARTVMRQIYTAVAGGTHALKELKVHKQHANRYLEPFTMIKVTATAAVEAWNHLIWQRMRLEGTVQPEFVELATHIHNAIARSTPVTRTWHVPYIAEGKLPDIQAVLYACGRAARESYRREDVSGDFTAKLQELWVEGHLTPFEHVLFYERGHIHDLIPKVDQLINPLTVAWALGNRPDEGGEHLRSDFVNAWRSSTEFDPNKPVADDVTSVYSDPFSQGWRQVRHIGLGVQLDYYLARDGFDVAVKYG